MTKKTGRPRLFTIPISHYCEKARWALEWAGIAYDEERHLQGFHFWPVYRATRADTAPSLATAEGCFTDSTDILRWCDRQTPENRKLYPAEPVRRREIEAFEDRLDETFGVSGRLWMYTYMLGELPLILRCSRAHGVPAHELALMPWVFPLVRGFVAKSLELGPNSREESARLIDATFDEVAERLSDGRPFLFGERFTAADLTFAALSAAVLVPENYGVKLPALNELPAGMRDSVLSWRQTVAGKQALRMFKDCRAPA